jgi:E3 ubiquitin-protein ligase HUWE1
MSEGSSSSASEEEEESEDADREETPDLYRNSALGIYGGVSTIISITSSQR